MQTGILSFSPGYENVYDLIYRLVPKSGGIAPGILWSRFWREYLSDSHTTPPAAISLLMEKRHPVPASFNEFLWHLGTADILTSRGGRLYRVKCSGGRSSA